MNLEKQQCPICGTKSLSLNEEEKEINKIGKVFLFSMKCSNCGYSKKDVEFEKESKGCKITFTTNKEKDFNIGVIKSSYAIVKLPQLRMKLESGPDSNGGFYKIKEIIEDFKKLLNEEKNSDEPKERKHARNLSKKLWKAELGDVPLKIVIEDPSGNSAILSDKAELKKS
jgi:zinc finger protein